MRSTPIQTVGEWGHRVGIFRRRQKLYLRWWDSTGHRRWRSLGHNNTKQAEQEAKKFSRELIRLDGVERTAQLTLADLFVRYEKEVSRHKKGRQPEEDRRCMDIWEAFFGADRELHTIGLADIKRFLQARRAGTLEVPWVRFRGEKPPAPLRKLGPVSNRGAAYDVELLRAAFNWATTVRLSDGRSLLKENPLRGVTLPKNPSPRRPIVTYDRVLKVLKHANRVDPQRCFGSFMCLIAELGWRVSAVCQLRAEDLDRTKAADYPYGRIHKRGNTDKEEIDMWVPLSADARKAIDRLPVLHGWLFPSPRNPDKPWGRAHAGDLLERTEKAAGLSPIEGGDFHPYRRAWATERKGYSMRDVAQAGGWKSTRMVELYQQIDAETMLTVVTQPHRLRENRG